MYKHWGLHISTNINCFGAVLGSFWAVWRGIFWCLKEEHWLWQFLRYWWFNKQYHSGYLLIYLISWPILIASRCDWYQLKGLFKVFWVLLRPWELLKIWWRYDWMKFVISLSILWQFLWSQWLQEALEKTFQLIPVTSWGDRYWPRY